LMYLRQFNKWREFLLAESSQPAVLLTEITYASAVNNLSSKKIKKAVYRWLDAGGWIADDSVPGIRGMEPGAWAKGDVRIKDRIVDAYMRRFKQEILRLVPYDLEDNQKGLALTWLSRQARQDPNYFDLIVIGGDDVVGMGRDDLEMFFHYQQFMGKKDLNEIKDLDELEQVVLDARDAIRDYQESKAYEDADAGTEVLADNDQFYIAALHNKGAACSLGKGTDWCTAAPGLDFFADYYKPDDPLFYFEDREVQKHHRPGLLGNSFRFQFHYGSEQFMDQSDQEAEDETVRLLHNALMQTEAPSKYPIVRKFDRKLILSGKETTPEILEKMLTEEDITYVELLAVAAHPNVGAETLQKLVKVRNPSKDYIGGVGKYDYGPGLKEQIARSKNATPEVLDELLEDAAITYTTVVEDSIQDIEAHHEKWKKEGPTAPAYYGGPPGPDLDEDWMSRAKYMSVSRLQRFFEPVFFRAIANENISNKRLEEMLEDDLFEAAPGVGTGPGALGLVPLAAMIKEKLAARRAGEELGFVDIRSRMIRRRVGGTAAKLPPLEESRIIQRWSKIIK
jgi:hypothetical protein